MLAHYVSQDICKAQLLQPKQSRVHVRRHIMVYEKILMGTDAGMVYIYVLWYPNNLHIQGKVHCSCFFMNYHVVRSYLSRLASKEGFKIEKSKSFRVMHTRQSINTFCKITLTSTLRTR